MSTHPGDIYAEYAHPTEKYRFGAFVLRVGYVFVAYHGRSHESSRYPTDGLELRILPDTFRNPAFERVMVAAPVFPRNTILSPAPL